MVALSATGEVFGLEARGGAAADGGWIAADGAVALTGDVMGELSLCHGLTAGLGARVTASAKGELDAFWTISAGLDLDLQAEASAFARGLFSGNVLDDFGVAVGAGAQAKAFAAAQLRVGLRMEGITSAATSLLGADSLALDLFVAFLNEVQIGGGVRGLASAGAAARAVVAIAGNLVEEPARIDIAVEAQLAAAVGLGGKAFIRCRIDDPRRMALTMSELATTALAAQARQLLPSHRHDVVEWFELLAPATTAVVWELAQLTAPGGLAPPEQVAAKVTDAVLGRLQTLVFDRAVEVALSHVEQLLRSLGFDARLRWDPADRLRLAAGLRRLAAGLPGGKLSVAELGAVLLEVHDLVRAVAGRAVADELRRPLTLVWTAFACGVVLRDPHAAGATATGSAQLRVVGAGRVAGAEASGLRFPAPPVWVRAEWAVARGSASSREPTFADGVDALIAMGLEAVLLERRPMQGLLREVSRAMGLSIGDLLETVAGTRAGLSIRSTRVYRELRDLLSRQVDDLLVGQLVPALRAALPAGSETALWLEEAVVPSLLGVRHVVLRRVDTLVDGAATGDLTAFTAELRTTLGVLASKVVLRNIVTLADILDDHLRTAVPPAMRDLATEVRRGGFLDPQVEAMTQTWQDVARDLILVPTPDPATTRTAQLTLLAGLLRLGADVWELEPATRIAQRRTLRDSAIRIDDLTTDWSAVSDVGSLVRSVMDCNTVPDEQSVIQMTTLLIRTTAERGELVLRRGTPLLLAYVDAVTRPLRDAAAKAFVEILAAADDAVEAAVAAVTVLDELVQDAAEDVAAAAREVSAHLVALRRQLRSAATRTAVLARLRSLGRQEAERLGGAAGRATFDVAWGLAEPGLRPAFDVLGDAAAAAQGVLDGVTDGAEAIARLSAWITDAVEGVGVDFGGVAVWLGLEDVVTSAASVVTVPAVRAELLAVGAASARGVSARARRSAAEAGRADALAERAVATAAAGTMSRTAVVPRITAPAPLLGANGAVVTTRGEPLLTVELPGGDAKLLAPGGGRRLSVRLNGQQVALTHAHLRTSRASTRLQRVLTPVDGLRTGTNVVECVVLAAPPAGSVLRGEPTTPRAGRLPAAALDVVAFGWSPGPLIPARRRPRPAASGGGVTG